MNTRNQDEKGTWVGYRPQIKLLDCTIRDGGLINDHHFDEAFVRRVYEALIAAGVDYMEVGYKNSKKLFAKDTYGAWRHCDEDDLRRVLGDNPAPLKLAAMADADKSDYREDILPKEQSILDCIRVATYIHQIPTALEMVKDAHEKGYETTLNLMAISAVQDRELEEALALIAESPVSTVVVVDSFGALYSEQVRDLVLKYKRALKGTGKDVGIHAHNNQQLAYANTIEALIAGADRLDATINGLGRGAGNCPLELLVGFLKNPKFHLRPILECVQEVCPPLKKKIEWGYRVPYMLTGQMNRHPRAAIKMRAGDKPDDYVAFYDQLIEEE